MPLKTTHLCKKLIQNLLSLVMVTIKINSLIIVYISGTILSNLYTINLFNLQYFTSLRQSKVK